jgi:antitoxin component YwqK of YwqJK toxin-antitoxin module
MKFLLAACLFFTVTFGFAQNPKTQQVFYFKYNGSKVPSVDSADYIRVINLPDSGSTLFGIVDYYRNSKPKLMGKSSTIDPVTFEEQCVTYYSNGKRESVSTYVDGSLAGPGYLFYPNGKLHLSLNYDTTSTKAPDDNLSILACFDTTGKELATGGNGRYVNYNWATRTINEEGVLKNGKPDGEWRGSYPEEKVTYADTYSNGKFVSGYCTLANGAKLSYTSRRQPPEFKGGDAAFIALIKKKFKYPAALAKKSASGALTFMVDKNGKVSQGRFLGFITPEINTIIATAINASPSWKPAIQNGLPVSSSWIVPVTFGTVAPAAKPAAK